MAVLSGCAELEPHKIPVQQGNVLKPEQLQQLSVGMTEQQVRKLLGSPLIQDVFHQERWDYLYHLRDSDGKLTDYHLRLQFKDRKLASWHSTLG